MRILSATDLGLVIRERRRELALDQRTLAERSGVSRQWLVAVERGKPGAEVGLVLRVMGVLGLRLDASSEAGTRGGAGRSRAASGVVTDADLAAVLDRARGRRR